MSEEITEESGELPEIPEELWPVLDAALPFYDTMRARAI